jgi:hypothetical protein
MRFLRHLSNFKLKFVSTLLLAVFIGPLLAEHTHHGHMMPSSEGYNLNRTS